MSKCRRCVLPGTVPGAELDAGGVCSFCREHEAADHAAREVERRRYERDLERALQGCRGAGEYDCVVGLSGGKDSCYLLYKIRKEYGLNPLAVTYNINIPDVAWDSIRRTVDALGVDHVSYTPPREFYRKLFRYLLRNQSERGAVRTVCYVCAPITESYMLRVATDKGIPLILTGYSPGQPDPERMLYEFSRSMIEETDWAPAELVASGEFGESELSRFWNPQSYPAGTRFPRFLAPFHAWEYSQAEVMKAVVELGLIKSRKNANPVHSNCPVNWLLMYSDLVNLGYNSYAPEFARLIREGRASRRYWSFMMPVVNWMIRRRVLLGRNVTSSLKWLGMQADELKITGTPVPGLPRECDSCQQPCTEPVEVG